MKRTLTAALVLFLLLSLTACGRKASGKIPGGENSTKAESTLPTERPESGDETENGLPNSGGEKISEKLPGSKGPQTETALPEKKHEGKGGPEADPLTDEAAQAALEVLYQCMEGTGQVAAVAYLGYRDAAERDGDLTDWLWTNVPGLMAKMAFLQSIPTDRVLNGDHGDLYCIVPRGENTSLAVNHVAWSSNGSGVWPAADEVLCRSEYAQPLLLFVRWEEFQDEPDVQVIIVPDGGTEVSWCPTRNMEDGGYIEIPTGENYEPLLLDFSGFGDISGLDYDGNEWLPPTNLGLANTIWNCGNWMLELHDGGSDPDYAGVANLSCQQEDGREYNPVYSGVWRLENDCLRLDLSAGVGTSLSGAFPVYIDLSGEHLLIQRDWGTYAGLPFFDDDAISMQMTLSYG